MSEGVTDQAWFRWSLVAIFLFAMWCLPCLSGSQMTAHCERGSPQKQETQTAHHRDAENGLVAASQPRKKASDETRTEKKCRRGFVCGVVWPRLVLLADRSFSDPTALFTVILAISTIGLWAVTWQTLKHARADSARQATDMQESLRISARAADAATAALDQPWLFMDPPNHNKLSWVSGQTNLETIFSFTNYGKAPAFIHYMRASLFLSPRAGMKASDVPFDLKSVGAIEFPHIQDLKDFQSRRLRAPINTVGSFKQAMRENPDGSFELSEIQTAAFGDYIVVRGEGQSDLFRVFGLPRLTPSPIPGIPIQMALNIYFLGSVIYSGPDGEMQQIDFCYQEGASGQMRLFAGSPYNRRHKADT